MPAPNGTWSSENLNTKCLTHLTRGQTIGLLFATEAGIASALSVVYLFLTIIRKTYRHLQRNPKLRWWQVIKSPLEVYMLSLFVADLLQGIGIGLAVRWIINGTVSCGGYCTAQGILQQLPQTAVAMSTLAIAVHTFIIIFFRRGAECRRIALVIVACIWLYVILFCVIAAALHATGEDRYDRPTPFWCWIGGNYLAERITGEYLWLWLTVFVSCILYVLLFLRLRGNIHVDERRWWVIRFRRRYGHGTVISQAGSRSSREAEVERPQMGAAKESFMMLLYPLAYLGLILGLSIVRWTDFVLSAHHPESPNHSDVPAGAVLAVQTIFALSGVVNVLLLLYTRPGLFCIQEEARSRWVERSTLFDDPTLQEVSFSVAFSSGPNGLCRRCQGTTTTLGTLAP